MNRDHKRGSLCDRVGQGLGIEVVAAGVNVGEDRRGAAMDDGVRSGHPGERRHDDLVALADPERGEGQLQRCGAGGGRQGVLDVVQLGEGALELGDLGTLGQPARLQRLAQRLPPSSPSDGAAIGILRLKPRSRRRARGAAPARPGGRGASGPVAVAPLPAPPLRRSPVPPRPVPRCRSGS